ncbi:MAG: SRPBCC family protein [bacterium]|nr:SRPBCC family protein [bacterium]
MNEFRSLKDQGMDVQTLEKLVSTGAMVITNEDKSGNLTNVTAGIRIDAPVSEVWQIITDYNRYHEFLPQTKRVRILRQSGDTAEVEYNLKLAVSVVGIGIDYTLKHTHQKPDRISFERISGDLSEVRGGWEFIPAAGGEKTLAFYSVYSDLKSLGRVASFALKQGPSMELAINVSTAVLTVKAMKERAESYI